MLSRLVVGRHVLRVVEPLLVRGRFRQLDRIEIVGDAAAGLLIGQTDQPHHEKERHHGGHEVRMSDLPCAAFDDILAIVASADDDDFLLICISHYLSAFQSLLQPA